MDRTLTTVDLPSDPDLAAPSSGTMTTDVMAVNGCPLGARGRSGTLRMGVGCWFSYCGHTHSQLCVLQCSEDNVRNLTCNASSQLHKIPGGKDGCACWRSDVKSPGWAGRPSANNDQVRLYKRIGRFFPFALNSRITLQELMVKVYIGKIKQMTCRFQTKQAS